LQEKHILALKIWLFRWKSLILQLFIH
jgi:hypothetical protein